MSKTYPYDEHCIAVIGMAARLPGADSVQAFWDNLVAGRQSMEPIPDDILAAGLHAALRHEPDYVAMRSSLADFDLFDAEFFGFSPRDASIMDPQHRLVLEYAWRAFENAGYVPGDTDGLRTGVYASSDMSGYLTGCLYHHILSGAVDVTEAVIGCDKDYLATRIAYKCNLHGPAMAVQSSCSSSLLSVHTACQALLADECDRALVTACTVMLPENLGYIYLPGGMRSPDGRCRPYDAGANGTIFANGVLAVLLKRLADAVHDRDTILAVVRATAASNDGCDKVGYTAPSIHGQAMAISSALELAGVDPADVDFVEGHGTATPLGDPIEVAALHRAYAGDTTSQPRDPRAKPILLGSLKGNIGHLDAAAGLASFAKASLCLHHRTFPGTANFERPNPAFGDLAPFAVSGSTVRLPETGCLLGGVSAFGIGGTNVHAILQSAPDRPQRTPKTGRLPLLFSAHNEEAFAKTQAGLRTFLHTQASQEETSTHAGPYFADTAATLARGRKAQPVRGSVTAASHADAAALLADDILPRCVSETDCPLAFLFPGQGNLHPDMARSFYAQEEGFRSAFRELNTICTAAAGPDLEKLLTQCWNGEEAARAALCRTDTAQPLLFALELSLARLLMQRGVTPACLIGHSLGEYTAACIAGVFSPEDGMRLVTQRGALMQTAPQGRMLVVSLHPSRVRDVLGPAFAGVEISLINSAANCVLTGDDAALEACARIVAEHGQRATWLATSHAFHSASMEPVMDAFGELVAGLTLHAPEIPVVSNLTGTWAGAEMATADYWVRHLRSTVQFARGLATLRTRVTTGIEAGPGNVLRSLATQQPGDKLRVVPGLDPLKSATGTAERCLADIAAECWLQGAGIDWDAFFAPYEPWRCPVPETVFTPRRYWIAPGAAVQVQGQAECVQLPGMQDNSGADAAPGSGSGPGKYARSCRTAYAQAGTEVERILVSLWEELLFMDQVGIDDDFVELGGNSIQVMQMVRQAAGLGLSFSSKDVFEAATIRNLAGRVQRSAAVRSVRPGPVPVPAFLAPALLHGTDALAAYQLFACPQGFARAQAGDLATALARRHDALRMSWQGTALRLDSAGACEWGSNNVEAAHAVCDDDGRPDAARVQAECLRLSAGLQPEHHRAWLLGLCADKVPHLVLLVHTALADQQSMDILGRDIRHFLQHGVLPEEADSLQQHSWKLWLEDLAAGPDKGAHDQDATDKGAPDKDASGKAAGAAPALSACEERDVRTMTCLLDKELTEALAEAATACRASCGELLLAAVSLCLKKAGSPDFAPDCIHCLCSGRHLPLPCPNPDDIVGLMACYHPVALPAEDAAAASIPHVKQGLRAFAQQPAACWRAGTVQRPVAVTFSCRESDGSMEAWAGTEDGCLHCQGRVSPVERQLDSLLDCRVRWSAQGTELVLRCAPAAEAAAAFLCHSLADQAGELALLARTSPDAQRYLVEEFPDSELTQADLDIILNQLAGVQS